MLFDSFVDGSQKGLSACGTEKTTTRHTACARYIFVGTVQPDNISMSGPQRAPQTSGPVAPNATFSVLKIPANGAVTVRLALAVATDLPAAAATQARFAADADTFDVAWEEAHDKWQQRWELAFKPENGFFSGNLPMLELAETSEAQGVSRVYYTSILTVISQMRTNLPLTHHISWPNGNGNVGNLGAWRGIGGSRSWWWDEALTSMMLALLEPSGRAPTFQAWLAHDDHPTTKFGHGKGSVLCELAEPIIMWPSRCRIGKWLRDGLLATWRGGLQLQ